MQAVYTALKETETRATDLLPFWKFPLLAPLIPRQRKALEAVKLIRQTTEELIAKCKQMVDAEEQVTMRACASELLLCAPLILCSSQGHTANHRAAYSQNNPSSPEATGHHALQARFEEGYINEGDPSVLRFLIASREEVSANQLRDDLLSMLVAGHETTGSVLTWTFYLLANNPEQMRKVRSLNPMHLQPCVP